jgi:D-alanine-D-alanine ligase
VKRARPKVAVVYNEPTLPAGHPDATSEADVVAVAGAVAGALGGAGFAVAVLGARPPLVGFVSQLTEAAPDLVFNLVEGFGGKSRAATHVTSVFELLGLPYTGSPVEALAACVAKSLAKALLRGSGIATAPFVVVGPGEEVPELPWGGPAVVKPDAEDGSLGIDQGSVVLDRAALPERVARLRRAYGGSVLIEEYLPGAEFNVGLVAWPEPRALPVAQVMFAPRPGDWPILTYAAKWAEGSEEDRRSPIACPAPIAEPLAARLSSLAVSAFRATGCRDYARVDLRLDARGEPMVLEVNPNPDVGPNAGWARAARASGMSYADAVAAVAREALRRSAST